MHMNIDHAIASVIERGQQLNIPNVFSAYFQRVLECDIPDGISPSDTNAIARIALISFERAMDKYPIPSRRTNASTKTKSKSAKSSTNLPTSTAKSEGEKRVGTKMYSAEVDQLRWDYQKAMLRATTGYDDNGCTCLSCGCLASLREKAALLAEQCENLERQLERIVPERRIRECYILAAALPCTSSTQMRLITPIECTGKTKKKTAAKKRQACSAPIDPYAASTSTAMI